MLGIRQLFKGCVFFLFLCWYHCCCRRYFFSRSHFPFRCKYILSKIQYEIPYGFVTQAHTSRPKKNRRNSYRWVNNFMKYIHSHSLCVAFLWQNVSRKNWNWFFVVVDQLQPQRAFAWTAMFPLCTAFCSMIRHFCYCAATHVIRYNFNHAELNESILLLFKSKL